LRDKDACLKGLLIVFFLTTIYYYIQKFQVDFVYDKYKRFNDEVCLFCFYFL